MKKDINTMRKDTNTMKKIFDLKDIIHEYEDMTLENAITVIMNTPLSKLLNLTENDKDIVFSELECNYATARDKFTFRDFIDVYPSFLKDTGMTMRGEIRSAADRYTELADTIEYMCNMAEQAERIGKIRLVMEGKAPLPINIKGFTDNAKMICALNVLCSMELRDYFAQVGRLYNITPDVYPFCSKLVNNVGCTVGKMLTTVRETIPNSCAYTIFEELILAPFSIARMRENFKRRRRRQQKTEKGVE